MRKTASTKFGTEIPTSATAIDALKSAYLGATREVTFTTPLGEILLHVALHGQYHRGKINLLLRILGRDTSGYHGIETLFLVIFLLAAALVAIPADAGAKKGKGRLIVHYGSLDEFDDLLARLGVKAE